MDNAMLAPDLNQILHFTLREQCNVTYCSHFRLLKKSVPLNYYCLIYVTPLIRCILATHSLKPSAMWQQLRPQLV